MSVGVKDPLEPSTTVLVTGILGDLQHLVEQQFRLTRREIEDEVRQRVVAAAVLGLGVGSLVLAAFVLCQTLVYFLHWMALPPGTDPARFPLWGCHAAVAAVLVVIGGILALVGRARFSAVKAFQNPVTELLQEHAPWTTPPK